MGQIIQFIVTIIHNPDIVFLDEPFSGLDPSNVELLKSMLIIDLKKQGKAVFLSAHNMNDVEELCDRILMVKDGREILYGNTVMERLGLSTISTWEIVVSMVVLMLSVIGVLLAAKVFSAYLLSYGKRPKFKDIMHS